MNVIGYDFHPALAVLLRVNCCSNPLIIASNHLIGARLHILNR